MRKKIVAGNWKMNLNRDAAFQLIETIDSLKFSNNVEVIIAPPSIYLESFVGKVKNINMSSQDVSANDKGAYTGEFSAAMLSSISLKYSIVGHSERRQYHGETDEIIFNKAKQLLKNNMSPIYCCGELLEDRKSENHFKVVALQLQPLLDNLNSDELEKLIIAYEPVWAIGTGLTAKPSDAQDMHSYIRALIKKKFSSSIADQISILYGGSCKPNNAKELFSMEDVDGGLIGGASLDADSFSAIINSL